MQKYEPLPFEWTRTIWTTQEVKNKYQPILQSVSSAFSHVERYAALMGMKRSHLGYTTFKDIPKLTKEAFSYNRVLVPVGYYNLDADKSYHSSPPQSDGEPNSVRYVICESGDVEEWIWAYKNGYNTKMGHLLGYPQCCIDFFDEVWVKKQHVDTTWNQALNTVMKDPPPERLLQVYPNTNTNMLLRWVGVRSVSHLPCSHACQPTIDMGAEWYNAWKSLGYSGEWDWMNHMLNWPIEWSALHGIAEIKTPVFKISTRTDSTPEKYVVQSLGEVYPEDGAKGITFPYTIKPSKVYSGRSFKASIVDSSVWEENGFSSKDAMDDFHSVVLDAIESGVGPTIPEHVAKDPILFGDWFDTGYGSVPPISPFAKIDSPTILDLGCGNGILLKKLCDQYNGIAHGVEIDNQRYLSALDNHPFGSISEGNIMTPNTWPEDWYDMIIFMPGRILEEKDKFKRSVFVDKLTSKTNYILFNLTSDWFEKYKSVWTLLEECDDEIIFRRFRPAGMPIIKHNNLAQLWGAKND